MSNNYEQATVQPSFPNAVAEDHGDNLQKIGVKIFFNTPQGGQAYLCVEDGCYDWDEFHSILQQMLDDASMKYCYVEGAMYCDKMVPGEFGGFAHFITVDDVQFINTGSWVMERESEINTGDQKL